MLLLCALIVGSTCAWAADIVKNESWTFNGSDTWTSGMSTYCGCYGAKSASTTVKNASISNFSSVNFSEVTSPSVTIYVTGLTNSGTNSYTVSLVDKDGNDIGTSQTKNNGLGTGTNAASASESSVTLTPVAGATGYRITVPAKGALKGTRYTLTYTIETVNVTGVSLNKNSTSIVCGNTETLIATVAPAAATNKNVSWTSNNSSIASVSDGVVTANAVGTATITVTTEDGDFSDECEVTVTPNSSKPVLVETVFIETFADCANASGGTDGVFNAASGTKITTPNNFTDIDGWTLDNAYPAKGCLKLGGGSSLGKAKTPAISLEGGKTYTLSFRAAPWTSKNTNLKVSMTNGTLSADHVTMTDGSLELFELTITSASADAQITFEGNSSSDSQFYLDDVKITEPSSNVNVTLNASRFASYCSPYALDLTPTEDYAAYAVATAGSNALTFTKIPGKVAANTPIILYGSEAKAGKNISIPAIEDDDPAIAAVSGNELIGTLSPTYVTASSGHTNYGLKGDKFIRFNAGAVKANKAYLSVDNSKIDESAHEIAIIFDNGETTGIEEAKSHKTIDGGFYNLAGQRVAQPTKGLYILNGKKVIVK